MCDLMGQPNYTSSGHADVTLSHDQISEAMCIDEPIKGDITACVFTTKKTKRKWFEIKKEIYYYAMFLEQSNVK